MYLYSMYMHVHLHMSIRKCYRHLYTTCTHVNMVIYARTSINFNLCRGAPLWHQRWDEQNRAPRGRFRKGFSHGGLEPHWCRRCSQQRRTGAAMCENISQAAGCSLSGALMEFAGADEVFSEQLHELGRLYSSVQKAPVVH